VAPTPRRRARAGSCPPPVRTADDDEDDAAVGEGARGGTVACGTGNDGTRWAVTRASLLSAASMARASAGGRGASARGLWLGTSVPFEGALSLSQFGLWMRFCLGKGPRQSRPDKTCVLMGRPTGVPEPTVDFEIGPHRYCNVVYDR
jgi:hypothetical protein